MQRYQCFANSCGKTSTFFLTPAKKLSSWRLNHLSSDSCSSGCCTYVMWITPQLREPKLTGGWGSTHLETYEKNRHIGPHFSPIFGGEHEKKTCHHEIQIGDQLQFLQWDRWIKVGTWRIWAVETISSIQKNIKWKTSAPKTNFYSMFFSRS